MPRSVCHVTGWHAASLFSYFSLLSDARLPGIAFANTVQNSSHAVILFVLLTLTIGSLGLRDLGGGLARIALAALGMAAACWALLQLLPYVSAPLFASHHLTGELLTVVIAGGVGAVVYFALAALLRVDEVRLLGGIARARLGGRASRP